MTGKKNELTLVMRDRIVNLRNNGSTYREIANILQLNLSTVYYVIRKYKSTGDIENGKRTGRPKVLTARESRLIEKSVRKNPFISSVELSNDLASCSGICVTPRTIRNYLHKLGYKGRSARKKPYISETNRAKRLQFAYEYINKPLEFWKKVIFTDESKFCLFGSDGNKSVWRKNKMALDPKNVCPTVKHGGGSIMVWGCMSWNGTGNLTVIEGILNARTYVEILRDNLFQSASKLGIRDDFLFQQDNDPKHTARVTKEFLLYKVPRRLNTPPQSPDLNPIENLWYFLDQEVRKQIWK